MKNIILILNVGSSSIKYSIYNGKNKIEEKYFERVYNDSDRTKCIRKLAKDIADRKLIITIIGHRVVHGKDISVPKKIDKQLINTLEEYSNLAPLHNIPQIKAIKSCSRFFKGIPQYAVFDTMFHTKMPTSSKIYGIPYKFFLSGIKRYGFHGLSHKYLYDELTKKFGKKRKVITCHLGNGCSITAIKDGISIDTSMGFTPLEGIMMSTRSGDIDPSVIFYLNKHEKLSTKKIEHMLNYESGLLGISGLSSDYRDLDHSSQLRSKIAIETFRYKIQKTIGSYIAALNGVDAIIFSAGIGENNSLLREKVLNNFSYLGIKLDKNKNKKNSQIISKKSSKVGIFVFKTKEDETILNELSKFIS